MSAKAMLLLAFLEAGFRAYQGAIKGKTDAEIEQMMTTEENRTATLRQQFNEEYGGTEE